MNTKKVLIIRDPNIYLKFVSRIYILLEILNKLFFGLSFLALIVSVGIYFLYGMENRVYLAISIVVAFLLFVFGILLYVMRDNISPENEIEKQGVILANQIKNVESEVEVSKLSGKVVKVSKSFGYYNIKIRMENGKKLKIRVSGDTRDRFVHDHTLLSKSEFENLDGLPVIVRQSSIKVKKYGWLRDHATVSVLEDNGRTAFKFETFAPTGDLFEGRKIFG